MLLEFSCSNYKSIKEPVAFSMMAGSKSGDPDCLIPFDANQVLRSAVIYGPNGSGKTNFLQAIQYLKVLVTESVQYQPGQPIPQFQHKLAYELPSDFSIQFVRENIRYAYGVKISAAKVESEYLYYFPKGRQTKIFERSWLEVVPGSSFKSAFKLVTADILKGNRLFLSCAANFSNVTPVEQAYRFFREDIVFYDPKINNWQEYSFACMQEDKAIKARFLQFLQGLGTGIQDVQLKHEKKKLNLEEIPPFFPDQLKHLMTTQEGSIFQAKIKYELFDTDLNEESSGIQKLFEIICPMLDILSKGKILIFDEIENGLHEAVVHQLIDVFKHDTTPQPAQLIFSTHDTSLLDLKLFRRDQIWFTELDQTRATQLYSLTEVKNVRSDENIARGYISGKYGAIPMLNQTFAQLLAQPQK